MAPTDPPLRVAEARVGGRRISKIPIPAKRPRRNCVEAPPGSRTRRSGASAVAANVRLTRCVVGLCGLAIFLTNVGAILISDVGKKNRQTTKTNVGKKNRQTTKISLPQTRVWRRNSCAAKRGETRGTLLSPIVAARTCATYYTGH